MGWESFGVVRSDLGPLLQGQTRIAKLKSAYNSRGVDILFLLFPPSNVTHGFQSFQEKVFILSLPNLVWVFFS